METGTTLQGKYVIEGCLGSGGMGAVYRASQLSLGERTVAIKHMRTEVDDEGDRARIVRLFRAEANLLAGLAHPALVNVFDYFEENDDHYFVMTYVDGRTLEQIFLDANVEVRLDQVLGWTLQICDVLSYLHRCHPPVIYRDLKPSNVMLDRDGKIWLLDFGIAKFDDKSTHTATLLKGAGTVRYASIEQVGMTSTDERADVYALGATLFTLLTRTLPPPAAALVTDATRMRARRINPGVPPELEAVVVKMTAVHKEDRYSSIAEVTRELRALLPLVQALPDDDQVVPLPPPEADTLGEGHSTQVRPPSEDTLVRTSSPPAASSADFSTQVRVSALLEASPKPAAPSASVESPREAAPPAPTARTSDRPMSGSSGVRRRRRPGHPAKRRWPLALALLAVVFVIGFVMMKAFAESAPLVLKWSDRPLSLRTRSGRLAPSDGMTIPVDTVVATPRSTRNLLTLEGSELRVAADSELTWQGQSALPGGARRLLVTLSRGRLWLLVGEGQAWAVQAGDVLVTPREGIVQVDHVNAACVVTVWQGRAEAVADDHPDKIVHIGERQQATWSPDETLISLHAIQLHKGDAWISWCLSDTLK